jgi:3-oxoisoapionate kinase
VADASSLDLLLAYYGDDFTGSTDVLESLTLGGIPTVLFSSTPTPEMLRRFSHIRAVGIAGNSRTMTPDEMEAALPAAFESLAALRPKFVHYKVCSTFDSSPTIGSIGRAIDIGNRVFRNRFVPLVVGSPALKRFCVFGNLFARSGLDSAPFRLDRHPTMRHHPVTPMTEADLRLHLSKQTNKVVGLVDVLALNAGNDAAATQLAEVARDANSVLFDVLTDEHLATIGQLIADTQQKENRPLFVVGSSGIENSLTRHWQAMGILSKQTAANTSDAVRVNRTLVVSGSCSPVTDRQITWALANGFSEIPLDVPALIATDSLDAEIAKIVTRVEAEFDTGRSPIVHTCRGPGDSRLSGVSQSKSNPATTRHPLGVILGRVLRDSLRKCRLQRVAVTGGDTSGCVARTLGIDALEMVGPFAPGAPLCRAHSTDAAVDGIEITFKGGQVGHDDFFGALLGAGTIRPQTGATT